MVSTAKKSTKERKHNKESYWTIKRNKEKEANNEKASCNRYFSKHQIPKPHLTAETTTLR